MHSIQPLPDVAVALVSINMDIQRGTSHGLVDPAKLPDVIAAASRYKAIAMRMLQGAENGLRLAYDPGLSATRGNSARYVVAGNAPNGIVDAVMTSLDLASAPSDMIVVLGPAFVEWQTTPEILTEVVADDLTSMLHSMRPIQCKGPIAKLMPYLVQIAGNIIIPGGDEQPGKAMIEARKERAIGRAFHAIAAADYDGENAYGMVVTDNPAWIPLANTVANAAGDVAGTVNLPLTQDNAFTVIQYVIARAMRACSVPVTHTRAA